LQLAHERGVVHRDLKPTNIVSHRYETGEIVWKIIDFGLVDLADPAATRLTEPYQFLGTATYAAPEQLSGAPVDARTDLYSLGVIAFELLAGAPPFKAESVLALLEQHLQKPPPDLAALRPEVPPAITGAVMRCLAKDPAERWSSASALSLALLADDSATVMVCTHPPRDGLLGIYELGEIIARGRFGSDIHRGVHRALGHPVAIRLFRPSAGKDRDAVRARFLREAKALQVPHPYIVQVRDFGESGDLVYVVTDLLQSCSLAERFQRERPLPLALVHEFVAQLIDAAAAIHHRGGLICGLHPGIVRVVEDGAREHVAISSAGICSLHDLLATLDESALRGRSIRGTELPYVAPELLMGKGATPQSDLFTIGVLAYEMSTGRLPFDAPSLPELIASMLGGLAATAGSLRAGLPSHEDQCITRCLAVDPGQRFSSVSELLLVWVARSGSSQVAR
jgi:serine/threonine protein kinase